MPATILDALVARAETDDDVAIISVGSMADASVTHRTSDLLAAAAAIAEALVDGARGGDGEAVLVACQPGVRYFEAFLGVLHAGKVPVPTYALGSLDDAHDPDRLVAIASTAGARRVLCDASFEELAQPDERFSVIDASGSHRGELQRQACSEVAFLQFTSGSTRAPKGVRVGHEGLLTNLRAIRKHYGCGRGDAWATWLPPFHDMGLIGGLLAPLVSGGRCVLLTPKQFVARPLLWLKAIQEHEVALTSSPNFGYEWCLKRIDADTAAGLDLSSWRVAINGAEPVRASTMRAFSERFAPAGFRPEVFWPSYGLAEATLLVAGRPWDPVEHASGPVSCGPAAPDVEVLVVDDVDHPVPDGITGHVLVRGGAVALGYEGNEDATGVRFDIDVRGGDGWLRTADLGFLRSGELHVVGRADDVIVWRGQKFAAEEVEAGAREHLETITVCAAVRPAEGQPTLVCEIAGDRSGASALPDTLRLHIMRSSGLSVATMVVPKGWIPRTPSGKVKRRACTAKLESILFPEINEGDE
ncbi:MAG: AMP-binding protein [Acidimicrobiales bacterium]